MKDFLEESRPKITFPDTFEIVVSTNDPGLNLTEIVYYDHKNSKIRMRFFYSILGLNPTKGFDVVID